jgi:dolichol-phosphate mannosyltransferase
LARKVGQGNATIAGLEESGGSWAITMDADGQDDPIFIIEMLKRLLEEENVDIILIQRPSEKKSVLYFLAAKLFYTQFSKNSGFEIPPGGGDYRLISRRVMDFVLSSRDPEPFLRGLVLYPSKNIVVINSQNYGANRRARNAGKSKYNFSKSFTVAMHGFLTFSTFPLKLVTKIGFILALVLPTIFIYAVFMRLLTNNWIPGGTLIIGLLVSLFGVNFIIQAIFAEYMRKSFKLAINRPRYIVERKWSYR